jgi:hypothetical protein
MMNTQVSRIGVAGLIPTAAAAVSSLMCITGAVREALCDCGIPHRDVHILFRPENDGELLVSFEVERGEMRDRVIGLLSAGIEDGPTSLSFTQITSMAKGLLWHRITAVVVLD